MPFRCSEAGPAEWIDRSRTIHFTLRGQEYAAHPGDTVSSALLANGETLLGRSFKYHRPRGAFSMANHDINALFSDADDTNIRGDVTPVTDGMALEPVNARGGLARDKDRYLDWFGHFMPVGFYYKAFHRPRALFPYFERAIRERAGLGRVDTQWHARRRAKRYGHADVLVIGAGPAGLSAALEAARAGCSVILVDENPHVGGSLGYQSPRESLAQYGHLIEDVHAESGIKVLTNAVALAYYSGHWVPVATPGGVEKICARGIVLATGLLEQPAVFRNNDRPGVMLASGAQRLLHRFGVAPCQRAVVLTANAEGYAAAHDLLQAGVTIEAVAAVTDAGSDCEAARALAAAGVSIWSRTTIYEVHGKDAVTGAALIASDGDGEIREVGCDGVIMSTGWAPAAHLLHEAGGTVRYDPTLAMHVPAHWPESVIPAGRVNGAFGLEQRSLDGVVAARQVVAAMNGQAAPADAETRDTQPHGCEWPLMRHPMGREFVDLDEDLQIKDLEQAAREGFDNIELMKRFSTVGMGPSQGKHANINAIRILAAFNDQTMDGTGSTTARPMYHPVRMEDLAGRRLRPARYTPLHSRHAEHDACFFEAGAWLRVSHYGDSDKASACAAEEVRNVRQACGMIDVSTLGKIEVVGPDAARLLEGSYTMRMGNASPGKTRYALMVDDTGVIIDDGVVGRLSQDHYYLTATSGHAAATVRMLRRHVVEWGMNAHVVDRTGQLAAVNLAGPASRRVLSGLTDAALDDESFPYLAIREATVCGQPARLMRVGFVGELAYEIHVPADGVTAVWDAVMAAGKTAGIRPFGVEAQRILRLEKGHIIVGQDTDGLTTPFDCGMSWAVHLKKPFFKGRGALAHLKGQSKKQLVPFALPSHETGLLPRECHLVIRNGDIAGRITSIAHSPTLGQPIGMAMVDRELAESGESLTLRVDEGQLITAERVTAPFYDPKGERQRPATEEAE